MHKASCVSSFFHSSFTKMHQSYMSRYLIKFGRFFAIHESFNKEKGYFHFLMFENRTLIKNVNFYNLCLSISIFIKWELLKIINQALKIWSSLRFEQDNSFEHYFKMHSIWYFMQSMQTNRFIGNWFQYKACYRK